MSGWGQIDPPAFLGLIITRCKLLALFITFFITFFGTNLCSVRVTDKLNLVV